MKPLTLFLALILVGCTEMPTAPVTAVGPAPTPEQSLALVTQYIHTSFADPYSVQDLVIEPAVLRKGDWIIFFSCNAKNGFGAYTGSQRKWVHVRNNQINWPAQKSDQFWNEVAQTVANG